MEIFFNYAYICRELDIILDEILQEHLKNPKEQIHGGDEENEYDLVDILIKEKQHGDLEVPITWDNIKAVIMVSNISFTTNKYII